MSLAEAIGDKGRGTEKEKTRQIDTMIGLLAAAGTTHRRGSHIVAALPMDEDARLGTLAIAGNLKTPGPQNTPLEGMSATGTTALLRLLGEAQATMIVMTTCHPLPLPDTARPSLIIPSTTVGQEAGKGAGDTAVDEHVDCICLYPVVAIIQNTIITHPRVILILRPMNIY